MMSASALAQFCTVDLTMVLTLFHRDRGFPSLNCDRRSENCRDRRAGCGSQTCPGERVLTGTTIGSAASLLLDLLRVFVQRFSKLVEPPGIDVMDLSFQQRQELVDLGG